MVRVYTLTLASSLDSVTITPQIYPEDKLRYISSAFESGGGGINVARTVAHLGGTTMAIFPAGDVTGEHPVALLTDENVPISTVEAKDWTRQNLHVHVESSGEQYRFVMPGATLTDDEFYRLQDQVLEIESGALLVISGSLPSGVRLEKLARLVTTAQKQGIRCTVDSSDGALTATLAIGNIELVKPNLRGLSALVSRELIQPDDVRKAAQGIVQSEKVHHIVISPEPQGALGVDHDTCVQTVPPPVKSQSIIGTGDSMVGAMTLKLAENAPFGDIVCCGVAAGGAAALNQGTRLCSLDDTQKICSYLAQ